jgi:hypothetical protein
MEAVEDPLRTLDFDAERRRVAEANDVFVPANPKARRDARTYMHACVCECVLDVWHDDACVWQDMRLVDLESEKARLDMLALRREEARLLRERQRVEIAARRDWLKAGWPLRASSVCCCVFLRGPVWRARVLLVDWAQRPNSSSLHGRLSVCLSRC